MIAMTRAQLAPALLLLLILLAAAAPLVPALIPLHEIRDRKINGLNKPYIMGADPAPADAYAGGEKKPAAPESMVEAPPKEDAAQKTSYVKGAGSELKPESKGEEKVLEAKINAEVKQMRKEAAFDDEIAELKAKELKSKPKNTTDDAEDQGKEKKPKSKADYSSEVAAEKEEKKEKKEKKKDEDEESEEKKKAKSKNEDAEKKEKKSKSKDDDDDGKKKEKKSKSKEEEVDAEKKSSKTKSGGGAYEVPAGAGEKKPKEKSESTEEKKKESKSKSKEDDFDAVPVETKADESMPAAYTPVAPAKKKTPTPYQAPTVTTMSASDSPDGYVAAPTKAAPTTVPASDSPDGYAAPTTTTMSASDSSDGYLPASDSPDGGDVPAASYSPDGSVTPAASDSPDGYSAPSSEKPSKVNVQSFEEYVPKPVLDMLSPTVKSLCAKTRFPYRCETSIAKLPETTVVPARQKDGLGVLTLAVDAVRAKIAEAKNAAKDIAVDPRTDKISKSAISDCMAMYDDIGTSYDTGMAALKRGDRATAATAFDAARTFVDTCDQGFLDLHRGEKPVMAGDEKVLAELSSNVLAINRYAQPGGGGTY